MLLSQRIVTGFEQMNTEQPYTVCRSKIDPVIPDALNAVGRNGFPRVREMLASMQAESNAPRGVTCCASSVDCTACPIRPLAVCGAVPLEHLPRIAAIAQSRRLDPGSMLVHEGDPANNVFSIIEGTVKLYKLLPDGRRQVTGFLIPGDFIGCVFGISYAFSAETVSSSRLCSFKRRQFLEMLDTYPQLEHRLLKRACSELNAAQYQMLLLGRKTAVERLASFLAQMVKRYGLADGTPVPLPMARTDIADFLGLTVETISRTFTRLRREGILELPASHSVTIVRPDLLEEAAGD